MNVTDLIVSLETIAPPPYAADWDNTGLLIGARDWPAQRVLLTIDLTEPVLEEAIGADTDAVVAYHPPIFRSVTALTAEETTTRIALGAARAGIAVYSPHTALDAAPGGINDWLAESFGAGDVAVLGVRFLLDPAISFWIGTTDATGSLPLPIPANAPIGATLFVQSFHLDAGATSGVATTPGQRLQILR